MKHLETMSYKACAKMAQSRRRKLDHNTYLHIILGGDYTNGVELTAYGIKLHDTDVVIFRANGDIELNSGGWKTITTRKRMNACIDGVGERRGDRWKGWRVWQDKKEWFVSQIREGDPRTYDFTDGMVLHPDGTVTPG